MTRWALVAIVSVSLCRAHEPITTKLTWTQEISRIVYKRCAVCHHEGGGSMSLVTYEETRPWAKAIRDEVLERRMPPWGPVKGFGEFRNDASLSEVESELLANWVEGGAPEGDAIYLPSPPVFPSGSPSPPPAEKLELGSSLTLTRDATALGVEPTGALHLVARRPDGSIVPLIWIRSFKPAQPKVYYFRDGVRLPKGTRLDLDGAPAALLTSTATPAR